MTSLYLRRCNIHGFGKLREVLKINCDRDINMYYDGELYYSYILIMLIVSTLSGFASQL